MQVKAVKFLPSRKMQAYRRLWIKDSQVTALFLYLAITLCLVGLGGHLYSHLLAMIENIIDKLCIHRSSASVHSFRPECIPKHIVTDQSIYTVMKLDSSCFPGKLHFLPARSLDQVVLDQHMSSKKSGDASIHFLHRCLPHWTSQWCSPR